ncbi:MULTISPECIES: hypothetical protein [unclassified Solibacillus]|uniref:hypothetical protein n=1 Tax=unclassified Solibacillus TaxID=2637870 RepID=UPI0030F72DDF
MNNKEKKIYRLYKAQKLALYWLLGIIVSGFIGLQLGEIQAIADYNYNLHEIMYFPAIISLFVAPVVLVIYIFLVVKYLVKRGKQKLNIKEGIKSIVVICSIVILISITVHQSFEVSTTGIFEIDEKLLEDR